MGERHWVKRFAAASQPGAYLRVLEEGTAGSGDRIEVLSRPADSVTVSEAMRAYYGDAELMRRLVAAPGLDPQWQETAASVLRRAQPRESAVRAGDRLIVPESSPPGSPVPADGALPPRAPPPSLVTARSGSTCMCRSASALWLLRLQHLHRRRAGARGLAGHLPGAGCRGDPAGPPGTGHRGRPGGHRVLRRRYPDSAPGPAARRDPAGHRGRIRPRARRRGHRRGQPGERGPRVPGRTARGRVHPDLPRHAERGAARARRAGPGARARTAAAAPSGPARRASSTSTWISSTARPGRPTRTGGSRWRRPWRPGRTTSPPTP